jgi:hypothetical protein
MAAVSEAIDAKALTSDKTTRCRFLEEESQLQSFIEHLTCPNAAKLILAWASLSLSVHTTTMKDILANTNQCETMMILLCASRDHRRTIHQELDEHKDCGHKSFAINQLRCQNIKYRFYPCPGCRRYILFTRGDYRWGEMDNNQDESYRLKCRKCGFTGFWECNYDDSARYLMDRNVTVIGNVVNQLHTRWHGTPHKPQENTKDKIESILSKWPHIIVRAPQIRKPGQWTPKQFVSYLYSELSDDTMAAWSQVPCPDNT